jgi:RNA polymerase sigma factor (sigma-70 family)
MNFPTTRYTLIQRIATSTAESDWAVFLTDYWRPICRFAARWGHLSLHDAEDVAAVTLETIIRNGLLARWTADRRARLRTLLCAVVRRILANRNRRQQKEADWIRHCMDELSAALRYEELAAETTASGEADAFYQAWAEELLQAAVESLLDDYHREGRGDYFRVLYGRVCEGTPVRDIAELLGLKISDVDNYYRHGRQRLETRLRELVRWHVARYASADESGDEFEREWARLGSFLAEHGGLEAALRQSYDDFSSDELREREVESMTTILKNVRHYLKERTSAGHPATHSKTYADQAAS